MSSKEQFALIVRIIGTLAIIYIVRRVVKTCTLEPLQIVRLLSALIALYMIRGAPLLVRFAYPEKAGEGASKAS